MLGRTFAVCDGWFCSVPGPTWINRLFAMSGTSQGRVKMPEGLFQPNLHRYDQPSVFLRLEQARPRRSLRIYFGDFPLSLLLADRTARQLAALKYRDLEMFFDAAGRDGDCVEPQILEGARTLLPRLPKCYFAAAGNAGSLPMSRMSC